MPSEVLLLGTSVFEKDLSNKILTLRVPALLTLFSSLFIKITKSVVTRVSRQLCNNHLLAFPDTSRVLKQNQTCAAWRFAGFGGETGEQMELFVHDLADLLENTVCELAE